MQNGEQDIQVYRLKTASPITSGVRGRGTTCLFRNRVYAALADLEPLYTNLTSNVHNSPTSQCWDYRPAPPHLASGSFHYHLKVAFSSML